MLFYDTCERYSSRVFHAVLTTWTNEGCWVLVLCVIWMTGSKIIALGLITDLFDSMFIEWDEIQGVRWSQRSESFIEKHACNQHTYTYQSRHHCLLKFYLYLLSKRWRLRGLWRSSKTNLLNIGKRPHINNYVLNVNFQVIKSLSFDQAMWVISEDKHV